MQQVDLQLRTLLLVCTLQSAAVVTNAKTCVDFFFFCYSGAAVLVQVP